MKKSEACNQLKNIYGFIPFKIINHNSIFQLLKEEVSAQDYQKALYNYYYYYLNLPILDKINVLNRYLKKNGSKRNLTIYDLSGLLQNYQSIFSLDNIYEEEVTLILDEQSFLSQFISQNLDQLLNTKLDVRFLEILVLYLVIHNYEIDYQKLLASYVPLSSYMLSLLHYEAKNDTQIGKIIKKYAPILIVIVSKYPSQNRDDSLSKILLNIINLVKENNLDFDINTLIKSINQSLNENIVSHEKIQDSNELQFWSFQKYLNQKGYIPDDKEILNDLNFDFIKLIAFKEKYELSNPGTFGGNASHSMANANIEKNYEEALALESIDELFDRLKISPRNQEIIKLIFGSDLSYEAIGKKYNVTRQRIVLLKNEILKRLTNLITKDRRYVLYDFAYDYQTVNQNFFDNFPEYSYFEVVYALRTMHEGFSSIILKKYNDNLKNSGSNTSLNLMEEEIYARAMQSLKIVLVSNRISYGVNLKRLSLYHYIDYSASMIELGKRLLPIEEKEFLAKRFDKPTPITKTWTLNDEDYIRSICAHLKMLVNDEHLISDYFPQDDLEHIQLAIYQLPIDDRIVILECFGHNLKKKYNLNFKYNNHYKLARAFNNLEKTLTTMRNYQQSSPQSFLELFPGLSPSIINEALTQEQYKAIYDKYDNDLNLKPFRCFWNDERETAYQKGVASFYHNIYFSKYFSYQESLFNYYPLVPKKAVINALECLPFHKRKIIQKRHTPDYSSVANELTETELEKYHLAIQELYQWIQNNLTIQENGLKNYLKNYCDYDLRVAYNLLNIDEQIIIQKKLNNELMTVSEKGQFVIIINKLKDLLANNCELKQYPSFEEYYPNYDLKLVRSYLNLLPTAYKNIIIKTFGISLLNNNFASLTEEERNIFFKAKKMLNGLVYEQKNYFWKDAKDFNLGLHLTK